MTASALRAPRLAPLFAAPLLAVLPPASAQEAAPSPQTALAPSEIVDAAPAGDWRDIAAQDLLVMTLAPDARGHARRLVIQLMPAPLSQAWVDNIRALARAHWYDGVAVTRVQDNYVAQWGDPDGEDAAKAKPLPAGLAATSEAGYVVDGKDDPALSRALLRNGMQAASMIGRAHGDAPPAPRRRGDAYADGTLFFQGWPLATQADTTHVWPIHCYASVGVGRGMSPDAGTGAELYAVIGHAPRHLDRNIAVVGRVIEGIDLLSSLPRGTGPLGFYEDPAQRVPVVSIRLASDLPAAQRPRFQYLATDSAAFARYADARANRRDPFFIVPAGGADICNIPVPIRPAP